MQRCRFKGIRRRQSYCVIGKRRKRNCRSRAFKFNRGLSFCFYLSTFLPSLFFFLLRPFFSVRLSLSSCYVREASVLVAGRFPAEILYQYSCSRKYPNTLKLFPLFIWVRYVCDMKHFNVSLTAAMIVMTLLCRKITGSRDEKALSLATIVYRVNSRPTVSFYHLETSWLVCFKNSNTFHPRYLSFTPNHRNNPRTNEKNKNHWKSFGTRCEFDK